MAAPKFSPIPAVNEVRGYESPDYVPDGWTPDRPAEIEGRQPGGARLGYQGPDQGYVLVLARRLRDRLHVGPLESIDDAVAGCVNLALRRASIFGRAPVIHDLTIAFTIWGFLDRNPPAELVAVRTRLFQGVANVAHHYEQGRQIADMVPETTLRSSPDHVSASYPERWRELTGA